MCLLTDLILVYFFYFETVHMSKTAKSKPKSKQAEDDFVEDYTEDNSANSAESEEAKSEAEIGSGNAFSFLSKRKFDWSDHEHDIYDHVRSRSVSRSRSRSEEICISPSCELDHDVFSGADTLTSIEVVLPPVDVYLSFVGSVAKKAMAQFEVFSNDLHTQARIHFAEPDAAPFAADVLQKIQASYLRLSACLVRDWKIWYYPNKHEADLVLNAGKTCIDSLRGELESFTSVQLAISNTAALSAVDNTLSNKSMASNKYRTPVIEWSKMNLQKIGPDSSRTVEEYIDYFLSIVRPLGFIETDFTKVFKFFIAESSAQELYHTAVFVGTDTSGLSTYLEWSLAVDWIQHRWRGPNEKFLLTDSLLFSWEKSFLSPTATVDGYNAAFIHKLKLNELPYETNTAVSKFLARFYIFQLPGPLSAEVLKQLEIENRTEFLRDPDTEHTALSIDTVMRLADQIYRLNVSLLSGGAKSGHHPNNKKSKHSTASAESTTSSGNPAARISTKHPTYTAALMNPTGKHPDPSVVENDWCFYRDGTKGHVLPTIHNWNKCFCNPASANYNKGPNASPAAATAASAHGSKPAHGHTK